MNNYSFNFNIDSTNMIRVSVISLGLIFNKSTINILGRPSKINIGVDFENKALSIRPSVNIPRVKDYTFVKNGNETRIRVCCKQIVKIIEKITGHQFTDCAKHFNAKFDKELGMIIVKF